MNLDKNLKTRMTKTYAGLWAIRVQMVLTKDKSLVIFLLAFSLLLTFCQVGLLLNDEWISANQLANLKNGSLTVDVIKYGGNHGIFIINGKPVGAYTHALPFFALLIYVILSTIDQLVNIRLFLNILWFILLIILIHQSFRNKKERFLLMILTFIFFLINIFLFKPLDFDRWGEILSINLLNIAANSIIIAVVYKLFKQIYSEKIGIFAAVVCLFGTPFSIWALTGKDHTLSLLFLILGIYLFYSYVTNSNQRMKYLAFSMFGLALWVRPEASIPLFVSLILTEILYISRNKSVRIQMLDLIKIFVVIVISLTPYFVNNYLLFENIFFPPMVASKSVIVAGKVNESAPIAHQIQEKTTLIAKSSTKIFDVFKHQVESYIDIPKNFIPLFIHSDNSTLMSIFEATPILMFSVFMIYRFIMFLRYRNFSKIIKRENYLNFLFVTYLISHFIIYSRQTDPSGLLFGQWDPRYFLPIYVPLLYFSISFLNKYEVFERTKEIFEVFISCSILLTPSIIYGFIVFGHQDFNNLYALFKILAWIAILFLLVAFIYMIKRRDERSRKLLAYAIGFSLFSTFFWVFNIGFIYGKAPCTGFVLPAMNNVHWYIAWNTGSRFFMEKSPSIIWVSTRI